ncbi:MAG: hypothetical protein AB7F22_08025 [Reyranella sp.]|uniref:hypothetical protein n=1 Tax=Reyranella sp. TaxID=1929291 RepID=UPI003D0BA5C3
MRIAASFFLCLFFLVSGASAADPVPTPRPIYFATGSSKGTVGGHVLRGERDLYSVTAAAGQAMTVTITAPEGNAVFQIYQPGTTIARDNDGILEFKGNALRGAGETDDATRWSGRLPQRGTYLIVIGSTRGNAGYTMDVKIE